MNNLTDERLAEITAEILSVVKQSIKDCIQAYIIDGSVHPKFHYEWKIALDVVCGENNDTTALFMGQYTGEYSLCFGLTVGGSKVSRFGSRKHGLWHDIPCDLSLKQIGAAVYATLRIAQTMKYQNEFEGRAPLVGDLIEDYLGGTRENEQS